MRLGAHISDYRIREQIAVGGFGTVWRAEHLESGRVAAIKILHSYLVSSEVLVKRFEREARAIALMNHPNIVELYEHGRLPDGRPYLIMEYLQGVDLKAHIAMRGTLLPREVGRILEQLGDALSAAHAQGIVHRDLKASNVFLSERNNTFRVVLFDFGIAKLLDKSDGNLTLSSSLVGSPACMSPEQILGRPVDARTDVYALGSLTYQMLVGHPPFAGANPTAIMTMHLDDYPPSPSFHGDVSPEFDHVVITAMSKQPGARFQNVAELVGAFRAALQCSESGPISTQHAFSAAEPTPAMGLYIDVGADPDALEEPEDALLDDMESVIPRVARELQTRGYLTAYERAMSALFVLPMSAAELADATARGREIAAALALFRDLESRPGRDARVHVRLYLHGGEVVLDRDMVEGGSLLDAGDWTPPVAQRGVFATPQVLAGVDVDHEELATTSSIMRLLAMSPGSDLQS